MDDYLDSVKTEEEAISRAKDVGDIPSSGDFYHTKWMSNSPEVLRVFQANLGEGQEVHLTEDKTEKIMGVCWKHFTDTLTFRTITTKDTIYTRRGLLKKIATIFDPLGFAAPLTMRAKIKLKLLNTRGTGWDEKIPSAEEEWWKKWFERVPSLSRLRIPRCLFENENDILDIELYTFGDASEEAFAAVVYLRIIYRDEQPKIKFIMAKTKLAPKKTISVARLELQAALLGAKLGNYVSKAFTRNITQRYFWTDSSCVRNWIRSPPALYKPSQNRGNTDADRLKRMAFHPRKAKPKRPRHSIRSRHRGNPTSLMVRWSPLP